MAARDAYRANIVQTSQPSALPVVTAGNLARRFDIRAKSVLV
jgi:hypothetical protein